MKEATGWSFESGIQMTLSPHLGSKAHLKKSLSPCHTWQI